MAVLQRRRTPKRRAMGRVARGSGTVNGSTDSWFDRFILGQRTPRRRHEQARYYLKQEERVHIW